MSREPDALVVGSGLAETDGYRELVVRPARRDRAADRRRRRRPQPAAPQRRVVGPGRPASCVLTPHPGEFARLTGRRGRGRRRASARRAQRGGASVSARSSCSRARARSSPRPTGESRSHRSPTPRWRRPAAATCSPGRSARCWPRACAPFDAACLGVYLHGRAGERLSWRLGDAGLLASDLPHEIAVAAPRAGAEHCASESIDERLSAAGLPPLPRARLARDRRGRAGQQRARRARAGRARRRAQRGRQGRRLRPRPGPGRRASSRRPAPIGCVSHRSTRRCCCATRAFSIPILVLFPIPPAEVARAARAALRDRRVRGVVDAGSLAAWRERPACRRTSSSRSTSRSRPASRAAASSRPPRRVSPS